MQLPLKEHSNALSEIVVNPADCQFSTDPNCRLITRNVLSCIALAVHMPQLELAALLRFSLPSAAAHPPQNSPWLCADTAIPLLFSRMRARGISVSDLSVYAIGGATGNTGNDSPGSAKANLLAMQRLLWKEGVLLKGDDTGGAAARSLWLHTGSGRVIVRTERPVPVRASLLQEGAQPCHYAS